MIDRILDKYTGKDGGNGADDNDTSNEAVIDDFGTFGFLRGSRERATMLELRKKDGSIRAVSYGYIDKADFDPSDGIVLHVGGQKITIKGRNLNLEVASRVRLFEAVCRHRVPWIQQIGDHDRLISDKDDTVIESIEW